MKFINIVLIIVLGIFVYKYLNNTEKPRSDFTSELITRRGYPVEIHNEVITEDGYILTIHRIPYGLKSEENAKRKYPVLLVPGAFGTSSSYVWMDADNSLGFLLADLGYDVWLGNIRSASNCQRHVKYDADKDSEFWNYTTHEVGIYDISAKIDYVLEKTGFQSLQYIGHSQGTLLLGLLLAERPDYNKKIDLFVGLAPGFFLNGTKDPLLSTFFNNQETIMKFTDFFGIQYLTYVPPFVNIVLETICSLPYMKQFVTNGIIYFIGDGETNYDIFMDIIPAFNEAAGLKQFYHVGQSYRTGSFQRYDYGKEGNLIEYSFDEPPSYNISNITVKTALYYSSSDIFIATENVARMVKQLRNVVESYLINETNFSHIDFILGRRVVDLLYKRIFKVMEMHKNIK